MDMEQNQSAEAKVTNQMISYLRSTKPWTKFLSVLGFIMVAFSVLIGLVFMIGRNLFPQLNGAPTFIVGIMYMLFSLIYLFPSIYLFKYSSSISRFLNTGREIDMESALSHQKSFWKFVGIVSLIAIIIAVLGIIAAIVIPVVTRMNTPHSAQQRHQERCG